MFDIYKDQAIEGKQVMIATGKILAICFPPTERKSDFPATSPALQLSWCDYKGFESTWCLYTMKISSQIHSTIASPRALRARNKRAESPSRGCWEPLGASKHRIQRGESFAETMMSCVICSVYLLIINIVHIVHIYYTYIYIYIYIYIHIYIYNTYIYIYICIYCIYINRYHMLRTYGNEQIPPHL